MLESYRDNTGDYVLQTSFREFRIRGWTGDCDEEGLSGVVGFRLKAVEVLEACLIKCPALVLGPCAAYEKGWEPGYAAMVFVSTDGAELSLPVNPEKQLSLYATWGDL